MVRRLSTVGALVAAVLALSGCVSAAEASQAQATVAVGRYSTVEATAVEPPVSEGDEVCTGQAVIPRLVDLVAWTEVRELRNLGLPACDVEWGFYDLEDHFGSADLVGGKVVIQINDAVDYYAQIADRDLEIRSTVRHEFGHALIYMQGQYGSEHEDELRSMFTEPLVRSHDFTKPGHEVAAEAIGEILAGMRGDDHSLWYVSQISEASLQAARAIVDHYLV